ncbi:hypothetical protein M8J75_014509 [Diaphorina citri]|nr:hypothetical protein M8J75_014509 [Diaphorina citri]
MDDTIGSVVTANPEGTRPRGKSPIWISSIEKLRNTCNMEAIDCRGNGLSTVLKVTAYTVKNKREKEFVRSKQKMVGSNEVVRATR